MVTVRGIPAFSSAAATRVREAALDQTVEVQFHRIEQPPYSGDVWYLEPVTEDGEVEFAAYRSIANLLGNH